MSRAVGIEVEFGGVSLTDAAAALTRDGGRIVPRTDHVLDLEIDGFDGSFRLEVDFDLLKRLSQEETDAEEPDALRQLAIDVLDLAASVLVPLELVSPPIPLDKLDAFEALLEPLVEASLVRHVRAFMVLYPILLDREDLDLTRQVTPYVDRYPKDYEKVLLAPGYQPDLAAFTRDYLEHNPTRNRALDLLPALAELGQEDLIRETLDDELIQARPTFHYRLPNCRLGDEGWSILDPWARWQAVEALADDEQSLDRLARMRLEALEALPLTEARRDYKEAAARWLDDH